jgi:nucleoside-diphosphate-sugar epimerase
VPDQGRGDRARVQHRQPAIDADHPQSGPEIIRLSSSGARLEFVHKDQADVELRIPNIEKARELLGYKPRVDLEEGLLRTVYWYRHHLGEK